MSHSGMQLPVKVKARAIVHPGFTWVPFLACEFLAGHSSSICHEELGWLKIFKLKNRWMSVQGLQS